MIHLPKQLAVYVVFEPFAHIVRQKTWMTYCQNPKRVATRNVTSCFGAVDCIDCIQEYASEIRRAEVILGMRFEY